MDSVDADTIDDEEIDAPGCPRCHRDLRRLHRPIHLRVLMGSKLYRCSHCRKEYLYVLGKFFSA